MTSTMIDHLRGRIAAITPSKARRTQVIRLTRVEFDEACADVGRDTVLARARRTGCSRILVTDDDTGAVEALATGML